MAKLKAIAGSDKTALKLGNVELACYVLEDGTRVFSGNGLQRALQFPPSAGGSALVKMLNTGELRQFITNEIQAKIDSRIEFDRIGSGGALSKTYGYDATLLIDICDILIEAKNQGKLTPRQEDYAKVAEIIIRSVAKVGIIALVDEATGYQEVRQRDALRAILDKYLQKEFSAWAKRFPDEFYKEIFRLKNWNFDPLSVKRPGVIGTYTNDIIYERLAPGILNELRQLNPKNEAGYRPQKHHQFLTQEIGHPALAQHMYGVLGLMRASSDWDSFYQKLQMAYPKKNEQMLLIID